MAPARPGDRSLTPRTTRLLVVLTVLGVLVGAAGLVLPRVLGGGSEDAERDAVAARVNEFAAVYNTYDVADLDEYQERMRPLLTEAYFEEFSTITDTVFGALESKDQRSGDANVLAVAVDALDDDSAVALVAVDATITTSSDEAAAERRFRWRVTLTKQGDEWLVSQFDTVVPMDATTEQGDGADGGAEAPSTEPTDGASDAPEEDQ